MACSIKAKEIEPRRPFALFIDRFLPHAWLAGSLICSATHLPSLLGPKKKKKAHKIIVSRPILNVHFLHCFKLTFEKNVDNTLLKSLYINIML